MKYIVTHTIEAESRMAATYYLNKAFKEGRTYDIQELPIYITNYKKFSTVDNKVRKIIDHPNVLEINITKNSIIKNFGRNDERNYQRKKCCFRSIKSQFSNQ